MIEKKRLIHHEWILDHDGSPYTAWILSFDNVIRLFNYTATFSRESDYPATLKYFPSNDEWFQNTFFLSTDKKNELQKEDGLAPVIYVQSNCNYVPSDRDTYVSQLMNFIKVDSYGKCLNNKNMSDKNIGHEKHSSIMQYQLVAKYKFQIAFENSICQDYMTEKVFRSLKIGSVPVYLGSPSIRDFMPSDKAVIIATDFDSPKDLANYLKELNENDTKYEEYLKHRKIGKITNLEFEVAISLIDGKLSQHNSIKRFVTGSVGCFACDKLHLRNNRLKDHILNSSLPVLPYKHADPSHMGCPMPKPIPPNTRVLHVNYAKLKRQAEALEKMIEAKETDSRNFIRYLL